MPETLKDVIRALPCDGATTVAFLGALPVALLDAHVYRSCPECGGSRVLATGPPLNIGEPCPVCADAPTAIVSAALREKAVDAAVDVVGDCGDDPEYGLSMKDWERVTDAVLSTVLGRPVRYGEVVVVDSPAIDGEEYWVTEEWRIHQGDTIAILEEAGKEE